MTALQNGPTTNMYIPQIKQSCHVPCWS